MIEIIRMIIAVAYTEYQLIQIQALVREYGLEDVYLITFKKNRIPEWLIEHDFYKDILWLPEEDIKRYRRITKSYLDEKFYLIKNFIGGKEADILIGAQDENTIFALIKLLAKPRSYWSIEDGLANYYHRNLAFKMGIFFKKILFNLVYGYKLDLSYGHGKVRCNESFRMLPELCVNKGKHDSLAPIFENYLGSLCEKNIALANEYVSKYSGKKVLVVTNLKNYAHSVNLNKKMLFKFHPEEEITIDIHDEYIRDYVPIEFLMKTLPDIKTVKFDSVSSSILNLLCLFKDINIEIRFNHKGRTWSDFFDNLLNKYPERIKM